MLYLDESDFHLQPLIGSSYSLSGEQTLVPGAGSDRKATCFGALDIESGEVTYRFFARKRALEFIEFLKHLRLRCPGALKIVVLDNYSTHKTKAVGQYVKEHADEFELLYLPTYSPHLNPIEDVWRVVKNAVCRNRFWGDIETLLAQVRRYFATKAYKRSVMRKLTRAA